MTSQVVLLKKDKRFGRFGSQTCTKPLEMPLPAASFQPAQQQLRTHGLGRGLLGFSLLDPAQEQLTASPRASTAQSWTFPCPHTKALTLRPPLASPGGNSRCWGQLEPVTGRWFPSQAPSSPAGLAAADISLQAWVRALVKGNPPVLWTEP